MSALIAERAGMKGEELGRVPLIVTDLATNLLMHASVLPVSHSWVTVRAGTAGDIRQASAYQSRYTRRSV
jgi:hypothetical protein